VITGVPRAGRDDRVDIPTTAVPYSCIPYPPEEMNAPPASVPPSARRGSRRCRSRSRASPVDAKLDADRTRRTLLLTRAALPLMRNSGFGRIVNNTTSYRTMLRVLPYGPAKAALESMSAVWAKELEASAITVNVLVPGGPTDTPMISDQAGWPREKMLRPEIMGPPIVWLVSDASADFNGQRITAARWDAALSPAEAAKHASRAIGWPELSADAIWLTDKGT
jgi:hypothetical protein